MGCGDELLRDEHTICLYCSMSLPLTHFHRFRNNPVYKILAGRMAVDWATSFMYFNKQSVIQRLLHQLKYKGKKEVGLYLGSRMGEVFQKENVLTDIDVLVPLPLHFKREKIRGYNQSAMLCEGLSSVLHWPIAHNVVERKSNTLTQTNKNRADRWENIKGQFEVKDKNVLKNKHILLVDDVLTTGATLESCGSSLLEVENLTLSIATLAYTTI